ncbi:MAG: DNA polymerase III subunit gamma/tau [Lentisphaeraceae bacterium]|nr:DNA polymerase III subunit gamma/tau [Lentisphaeraceae bacterium]
MVGQDHISSTLCNAIKNNRVGHAYLFVGTRGTGKTTTARIFAKAINCENPLPDANPCNKCGNCVEITNGSSMDVLEIDGASNNGVDDIRRLRDNVQYTPARCKFKVYIIDEVHMLSTAAWNALLKTLEEPPEHVKFLFATTEAHKVLPTILSRCQRFDLKRISQGIIARRLQEIATEENAKFDSSALNSIARAANGGMRDALSIMDQMIAFCSDHEVISEHDVSEVFGLTSSLDLGKIMSAMLTDNASQLINEVNRLADIGRNLEQLYSDLLHFCRNLMICAISGDSATVILDLDEYDYNMAQSIVSQTSADTIQKLMDGFLNYDGKLRSTLNKRVFMEMTLVRIMKDAHTVSLNDILARINHLRKTGSLDALEVDAPKSIQPISLPEPQKKNDLAPPAQAETPIVEETLPSEPPVESIPEPPPLEEKIEISEPPEPVQSIEAPPIVEEVVEEPIPEPPVQAIINEPAPVEIPEPKETQSQVAVTEQREIDDSFELPYSTFIDEEYIAKARLEDPLNIGVKKTQGNFDESRETPGAALGLFHKVGSNKPKAQKIVHEPVADEKVEVETPIQTSPPALEEINEPDISTQETVQEIKETQEEYIPEQAPTIPQQKAGDSLEEITQDLSKNIPEETPESHADSFWKKLEANDQSSRLKTLLKNLKPVSYQENRFYAAYETGQFELDEASKALIEGELKKITDNSGMELMLVGASKDAEEDKPVLTSGEDVWNRVQSNPLFTNICKEFDGKIIDVRG